MSFVARNLAMALGVLLALAGAICVWQGWDIVQVERGWTLVISGAVVFAGGAIMFALGLLTREVYALRKTLNARDARLETLAEDFMAPAPVARGPNLASPPPEPRAVAEPPAPAPMRPPAPNFAPGPEAAPASFAWPRGPAPAPAAEGVGLVADDKIPRPRVLRQFDAKGVAYTLYSDGSIESDSPEGRLRFANMESLRAYLARI
jgi:hypothetical protein